MARTIAIANQKGGVGKTTTTINVGAALVELGHDVLLVDLDPQAALTTSLGIEPSRHPPLTSVYDALVDPGGHPLRTVLVEVAGMHVAPASIDLAGAEVELLNEIGRERILADALEGFAFDYVLIDCPPSLGLLTINALAAADEVLIPVQCQYLALRGMELLVGTIGRIRARANPGLTWQALPTFYDKRTAHARDVLRILRTDYAGQLLDVPIPVRVALADAAADQRPLLAYDPTSDAAEAYRSVARRLADAAT